MAAYRGLGIIAALLSFVSTACSDEMQGRAATIVCNTAYRVSTAESLTEPDQLRFEDEDVIQSIPYIYLEIHAQYSARRAEGERSLRLWVTPTAEENVLVSQLYQLPEDKGPENQFLGDHGFTGLNYAYDPVSGAELQYWCEVD